MGAPYLRGDDKVSENLTASTLTGIPTCVGMIEL